MDRNAQRPQVDTITMNTNEKCNLPPEVLATLAKAEQANQVRNQVTVGALLGSISHEHLGDRQASPDELLRVADVGKNLLYAALGHRDATPAVLEEAREFWGSLVDAALQECGVRDPL